MNWAILLKLCKICSYKLHCSTYVHFMTIQNSLLKINEFWSQITFEPIASFTFVCLASLFWNIRCLINIHFELYIYGSIIKWSLCSFLKDVDFLIFFCLMCLGFMNHISSLVENHCNKKISIDRMEQERKATTLLQLLYNSKRSHGNL